MNYFITGLLKDTKRKPTYFSFSLFSCVNIYPLTYYSVMHSNVLLKHIKGRGANIYQIKMGNRSHSEEGCEQKDRQ